MSPMKPLETAIRSAESSEIRLAEVFLQQEALESGSAPEPLLKLMKTRLAVMRHSWKRGMAQPQVSGSGLLQGDGHRLAARSSAGSGLLGPDFTRLIAGALGVGEVNACMGRVVAAPTAGSCGVLPAAVFTCAETQGWSEDELAWALFTAGGIGMAIAKQATLSGAEGGCQAEVGSASAMAAGALVELGGGSPRQVGHAVGLALSNLLGLICDPVAGLVEVPCVARNAMGAANAVLVAEMVLGGAICHFSPDEVIETMGRVGRRLPEDYRETARGGLALLSRQPASPENKEGMTGKS